MRLRVGSVAVAAAALLAATAGCSSHAKPTSRATTPTTLAATPADDTPGPGTPIVAGVKVQPGSRLLGTTFPGVETDSGGRGTIAVIAVDADLTEVFPAYVDALGAVGFRFGQTMCDASQTYMVDCGVQGSTAEGTRVVLDSVTPGTDEPGFATTLRIQYVPAPERPSGEPTTTLDEAGQFFAALPPPTSTRSAPDVLAGAHARTDAGYPTPTVGQPVAAPPIDFGGGIGVVPGSRLLGPASPLHIAGCQGWSAVARVTDDPEKIRDAYVAQPGRQNGVAPQRPTTERIDGREVLVGNWYSPGGLYFSVRLTTALDGQWFALLIADHDC